MPQIMKNHAWNSEKNRLIKEERNISFEEVALNIQIGNEVDIYDHPNKNAIQARKFLLL